MKVLAALRGHRGDVLCVKGWKGGRGAVSGGDDGVVRVWDWPRSKSCVRGLIVGDGRDVMAVEVAETQPHRVFAASGRTVYEFDLRSEKIVLREFRWKADLGVDADNEVNSLALNAKETFLAACDDSGDVAVMDLNPISSDTQPRADLLRWRRLRRSHSNVASTVAFRPGRTWELVSSSLDCSVLRWDYNRGRVLNRVEISAHDDANSEGGEGGQGGQEGQLVNPPFVHDIAVEATTRAGRIAAAAGSGQVVLLDMDAKKPIIARGSGVHGAAISAVCWLREGSVVSGGVDSKLALWSCADATLTCSDQVRMTNKVNALSAAGPTSAFVALQSTILHVVDFDRLER